MWTQSQKSSLILLDSASSLSISNSIWTNICARKDQQSIAYCPCVDLNSDSLLDFRSSSVSFLDIRLNTKSKLYIYDTTIDRFFFKADQANLTVDRSRLTLSRFSAFGVSNPLGMPPSDFTFYVTANSTLAISRTSLTMADASAIPVSCPQFAIVAAKAHFTNITLSPSKLNTLTFISSSSSTIRIEDFVLMHRTVNRFLIASKSKISIIGSQYAKNRGNFVTANSSRLYFEDVNAYENQQLTNSSSGASSVFEFQKSAQATFNRTQMFNNDVTMIYTYPFSLINLIDSGMHSNKGQFFFKHFQKL